MLYIGVASGLFVLRAMLANHKEALNQVYYPILLGLFLFSAFRFEVGCDWIGYYWQYFQAESGFARAAESLDEPLWWGVLNQIKANDLPYPVANVISSAIFFIGIHVLARRQPDKLAFLVLLFPILIINMPMSAIRQGAAIGLICIAFTSFLDRRPFWFAAWVLIAAGFHTSAAVFLPLAPIATGAYTRARILLSLALAVPGVLYLLTSAGAAEMAVERYVESNIEAFGAPFRVAFLALSGAYFLVFLRRRWARQFPQDFGLVDLCAMGMVALVVLLPVSSVIADRLGYFFVPIQAVIFARIPYFAFDRSRGLHIALPYIALMLLFTTWVTVSWHFEQCYVPYETWLLGFRSGAQIY